MKAQPIGASGQELRATSVVAMETMMKQIEQTLVIPCFVMTSVRPIWHGAIKDCCMVLRTNAMVEFKMQTVNANGNVVKTSDVDIIGHAASSCMRSVFLVRAVHMYPKQSNTVEVNATSMDSGV